MWFNKENIKNIYMKPIAFVLKYWNIFILIIFIIALDCLVDLPNCLDIFLLSLCALVIYSEIKKREISKS
jgi:succinate-acetate transporter protein